MRRETEKRVNLNAPRVDLCAPGVYISYAAGGTLFPFIRVTRFPLLDLHNLQELFTLCTVARDRAWKVRTTWTTRTQGREYWREYGHLWKTLTDFCEREKIFANLEVEGSVFRVNWPFGAESVPGSLLRMALPPVSERFAAELQKVADRHSNQ
ncbi:MAG: hypothetical protein AMXMBFR47_39920 [Planctomycetota bacterium]